MSKALEEHWKEKYKVDCEDIVELKKRLEYWKKDSATAWDRCEERRIENNCLEGLLLSTIIDLSQIEARHGTIADQTKDEVRKLKIRLIDFLSKE